MNRPTSRRLLVASLVPVATAGLALLFAVLVGTVSADETVSPPAWWTPALLLAFAATSLHHLLRPSLSPERRLTKSPRRRSPSLGLATVILPLALVSVLPVRAALLAAGGFLLGIVVRHLVHHFRLGPDAEIEPLTVVAATGRIVTATLVAGWVVRSGEVGEIGPLLGAGFAYLVITAVSCEWERHVVEAGSHLEPRQRIVEALRSIAPEGIGWLAGLALAAASQPLSWGLALGLIAIVCALVIEAFRQAVERQAVERRASDLEHLSRAGQRMATLGHGLAEIAEQFRTECRQVIAFHWFQFELLEEAGGYRSWWAGPRGMLQTGYPDPGPAPPALPGIHRRTAWKLLERTLTYEERRVARLRLWCDPRLVEPGDEAHIDELLPQMSASLQRSLLDREAREDPLTGALVRRVLERRLEDVFAKACDDGRPMAVVLCDIDHFKRINDRYGHEAGDRALVLVAHSLDQHRRDTDLCCRYGGEEFALLLEQADGATALSIAERLREAISALEFRPDDESEPVQLTISAGAASFPELFVQRPHDLLSLADKALYEAKDRGRDRVLLNLGNGRYQTVAGEHIAGDPAKVPEPIEPPRLFV